MKRFLIVLVVILLAGVALAEAKVSFGGWDKWDEQLPAADNGSWYWAIQTNKPRVWTLKGFGNAGSDVELLFSDIWFFGTKSGKIKASVIFYSSDMDVKKWDVPDASLALAAFPPKKGRMVIRTYKMEKNKVFKFYEEWEIPFKDHEIVVPQDRKFRGIFEEWLKSQISSGRTIPQDLIDFILPELIICKENTFLIINAQPKIK